MRKLKQRISYSCLFDWILVNYVMFGWLRKKDKVEEPKLYFLPCIPGTSYTFTHPVEVGLIPLQDWIKNEGINEFKEFVKMSSMDWAEVALKAFEDEGLYEHAAVLRDKIKGM